MTKKESKIVVAGDVTVDWFMYPVKARDKGDNWCLHDASHADVLPGGAALLTSFIKQSIEEEGILATVTGPELPEKKLRNFSPEKIIHSNAILGNFKTSGDKKTEVLRIKELSGYIGPQENKLPSWTPSVSNDANIEIVILDDAGNGFREMEKLWPEALESVENPIIIYKMSLPLLKGKLWEKISEKYHENLIVIINANDLRKTAGIHLSKSLSWDRTAKDLVFELQRSDALNSLRQCPYLVVSFGTDGAILYHRRKKGEDEAFIVFDPCLLEDSFASNIDGTMMGLTSIFTATLAKQLIKEGICGLTDGIKQGLANSRALLEIGYKINNNSRKIIINPKNSSPVYKFLIESFLKLDIYENNLRYPSLNEILKESTKHNYASSSIELPTDLKNADPKFWRILDNETLHIRQLVAREIVLKGNTKGLENVPICRFGEIETIDRAEIESYSAIKELITEFLSNPNPKNPLCFAVFGPPGSGKSLGVKQILKSIDPKEDRLKIISFNISQFDDYQDLISAFHKVRDIALSDKIPFVFFDEFDSDKDRQSLGWLKYFLAPMQDGEFKDGDTVHPIGNAIFVFAGGTRYTFENFVQNTHDNGQTTNLPPSDDVKADKNCDQSVENESVDKVFKDAKGPDFVSRLRGFINVMGPNRQRTKYDDDDTFIIRRAKVLRVLLEKDQTAAGLFNSKREISIDEGVLRAMLNVTKYKHGTRSMTALIEMSRLAGKNRFDLSALPVKKQLDMHVDADEFLFLAEKERYQSMLISQDLPNPKETSYLKRENEIVESVASSMATFIHGSFEELKTAAEDIPNKLWAINNGIRKVRGTSLSIPDITGEEIETFARLEYERLRRIRRFDELSNGKENMSQNNSILWLNDFNQLNEDEKDKYRQLVYKIPPILKKAGYEIYRLKKVEEITDPKVVERLARFHHTKYVEYRESKGETPDTNPSLVEFDKLPPDIREANFDNIRKIPEKLSWIDYKIRYFELANEQKEMTLTPEEIKKLAIREHDRWVWQKITQGWVYKEGKKDFVNKTSPFIVPWNKLPPDIRENDFNSVRLIPELLKEAGYEAYKPDSEKSD
ncbi:RyR domain-containing protein [Methanosarcina vacuolata]|uniref:Ryanodine receptor Ryr domain-containing protein n=1 Tax=Methanosarcina vacuolata Z-761 TaxID=1434123 RepID=A0A0E3Q4B6_9EURY|nr:RyR domain-containing protein [Methanosarcina vacuolata]AKB43424.1 hypothetical protein MSVAZ_1155 [Methanosarcina vacuolata Z-761]